MIEIKAELKNAKQIEAALKRYPQASLSVFNTAIRKSVLTVQRETMKRAPVNKQSGGGNLRQSIKTSLYSLKGIVYAGAKYAIYVHEGTRPHTIRVKNKKVLANRRSGQFFGREVKHPGTRKRPFLLEAVNSTRRTIDGYFTRAMIDIIKMIK